MVDDGDGDGTEGAAERETYRLGPDGRPVDAGGDREPPEPETAAEHRRAARRALRGADADAALEHLDRAVELALAAGEDDLATGALVDRGNVRLERVDADPGDPRAAPDADAVREAVTAAVEDYTAALTRDPEHGEAYFNRGLARARLGEREASTADLERAADLGAGHPFLVRGNARAEAGADEAAREDFTRAVERTDAARAHFNRGNANRRLGDRDAAAADYRAALDRADGLPDDGRRVLVALADLVDDRHEAARHRVRAACLAVVAREVWAGVDLAASVVAEETADGPAADPWLDAAALVLAGDALRETAGYGRNPDREADRDTDALRAALDEADLPAATAALFAAATDGDPPMDAVRERVPADPGAAVTDRDDAALRAAAAVELRRQLRPYRR